MNYRQDNQDDTWAGLIPEQPKDETSLGVWLAVAGVVFILLCLCAGGGFLVYNEFILSPTAEPPPVVPTIAGGAAVDTPGAGVSPAATDTIPTTAATAVNPTVTATTAINPTVTLPSGATIPTPTTSSNVDAVRLAAPPTIDGSLTEWGDAPTFLSAFRVFSAQSWDGTDDLTAVWRLAWDNTNLYIGVEVTDDTHVQTQTGNQIFRGDSLDMQFDTDRNGDFGDGLSPDDFQITFSPGDFATLPPSAFRFQGRDNGAILDAPGGSHETLQALETAAGYTLEAAIPWSDLNLTPHEGLVIGIALNANDDDTPGTAVQEVMMSHVSTRTLTDPRGWGTLTLK
ncbi:MAG: sugar-binding protein [Candidatus Promineifilaceae bacterium]